MKENNNLDVVPFKSRMILSSIFLAVCFLVYVSFSFNVGADGGDWKTFSLDEKSDYCKKEYGHAFIYSEPYDECIKCAEIKIFDCDSDLKIIEDWKKL